MLLLRPVEQSPREILQSTPILQRVLDLGADLPSLEEVLVVLQLGKVRELDFKKDHLLAWS